MCLFSRKRVLFGFYQRAFRGHFSQSSVSPHTIICSTTHFPRNILFKRVKSGAKLCEISYLGEGYLCWQQKMQIFCRQQRKLSFVNSKESYSRQQRKLSSAGSRKTMRKSHLLQQFIFCRQQKLSPVDSKSYLLQKAKAIFCRQQRKLSSVDSRGSYPLQTAEKVIFYRRQLSLLSTIR